MIEGANGTRITKWIGKTEKIKTEWGKIKGKEFLNKEKEQIQMRRGDKCYIKENENNKIALFRQFK